MEQITIQGHRGERTIDVKRKRRFANIGKESASTDISTPIIVERPKPKVIQKQETIAETINREVNDFEQGLLASISDFNESKPRRKHRRDRDDYQDNFDGNGKRPYRREKSWRK